MCDHEWIFWFRGITGLNWYKCRKCNATRTIEVPRHSPVTGSLRRLFGWQWR